MLPIFSLINWLLNVEKSGMQIAIAFILGLSAEFALSDLYVLVYLIVFSSSIIWLCCLI